MEYEAAYFKVCEDLVALSHAVPLRAQREAESLARSAERHLAAAFDFAVGQPDHPQWPLVFASIGELLELCSTAPAAADSPALDHLRTFLAENAPNERSMARAS